MIAFRGDVEGLRAVAVLLVVLDHLEVPGFRGGFMGVDVFFVISGYLITSLLAAECAKKAEAHGGRGSISIPGFYARRARRILPAALTVIVAVVVAGGVLLNELRVAQIRHDAVWAALFGSNVNFIRQATDYSAQGLVDSSPFQHYWSLAVEEQFYLVWPALFLLVALLTFFDVAMRWRARVAIAVCAIAAASLAWSIVATERGPVGAYFSTFTRAWELALGALIGITTTSTTRFPRPLARAASAAGVALFAAATVVISDTTPFPGAAALLPTAATALLIVGGITERLPFPNRALCLSPLRFIGRISYSVYLWHWPLVVFAVALYPTVSRTVQMRLLILLVTLAVATLSYYLVERPGRRIGVHGRPDRASARPPRRGRNLVTTTVGVFVLAAVFVGVVSAIDPERSTAIPVSAATVSQPARPSLFPGGADRAPAEETPAEETPYARTLRSWQMVIRAGLGVRQLPPSLRPLSPHLSMAFPPPCIRGLPGVSAGECVVGNPAAVHVAVLNGDSHAEMLRNAVWRAFDPKTWSVHMFARDGCGWAGAEKGTVSATTCRRLQTEAIQRIRALHPDVLLLSEHLVVTEFRSRADIASSLATLRRASTKTIVIGHTPPARPWSSCLAGSDITSCFTSLDRTYLSDVRVEQQLAARAGATFVDSSAWLCVPAGAQTVCPPVIDGVPAFKDDDHVGAEYQLKLRPIVRALLITVGVPVGGRA
jgi:peptidoglycan/LPS O-acetylase OafA/YrhL